MFVSQGNVANISGKIVQLDGQLDDLSGEAHAGGVVCFKQLQSLKESLNAGDQAQKKKKLVSSKMFVSRSQIPDFPLFT